MSEANPTPAPPLHVNLFFRLAAGLVVLFVITIFAMIANLLGDPRAPVAQFLDRYALHFIIGETIGILITGTLAMTIDQANTSPPAVPLSDEIDSPARVAESEST